MFSSLTMSQAIIIAISAGLLSTALVVIVGQFVKPDPKPRLYCSVEDNTEKKAEEINND